MVEENKKNESLIAGPTEVPIKMGDRILFGDFVDKENETRVQKEITDMSKLTAVLEETLDD